jgi:lipoyl(octanoyl) transferase
MMQQVIVEDLGLRSYQPVWDFQEKLLQSTIAIKRQHHSVVHGSEDGHQQSTENYFLFVEHPPVYTLGKSGNMSNLLLTKDELITKNIEFVHTNRGGDITFHGPGQVVGYPILDLEKFDTDIGKYLRNIEEVIIRVLAHYSLAGERSVGETGVWLDADDKTRARKICAIGVRCSRWVTMHGFALNVNTDLAYFNNIIPCGITDKSVTSMAKELDGTVDMDDVKGRILDEFEAVFGATVITSDGMLQKSFGI